MGVSKASLPVGVSRAQLDPTTPPYCRNTDHSIMLNTNHAMVPTLHEAQLVHSHAFTSSTWKVPDNNMHIGHICKLHE